MDLAYFITTPLIGEFTEDAPDALLDPDFPPEIVNILIEPLTKYFLKKYPDRKKSIGRLPEDLIILLGEMEFVVTNQLVFLKDVPNDDSTDSLPLPHVVQDLFHYLKHEDINALPEMMEVTTSHAQYYLNSYYNIILEKEKASSFIRDTISKSFAMFILNMCDDSIYVYRMIDEYPYLFLWKPVLMSFIKVIDQLAHVKYLEFGKVPEISYVLRKSLNSDRHPDIFGELVKKCKRLTLFALISNHSYFKAIVNTVEEEYKNNQMFQKNLASNTYNFSIELIQKWISEYSPNKDEYMLKIEMILKEGKQPTKITEKVVDSYFNSDVNSFGFLQNPLKVLSFDQASIVPNAKNINYFLELTINMLSYEENMIKSLEELESSSAHKKVSLALLKGSGSKLGPKNVRVSSMIENFCDRIKA